ncbi:putative T7SS-secreted protein [Actinophytocola gossypii]|uniref:EndoU domain-containing protein n=1 Tax=Actinophytocola gossypii TaxID=2812003 RepID=A0ABT2J4F8_9PSEU|nr:EndoU domain-containing protein [Actinophytocola gossypii]MCT2582646.1 EndoU domain-containing protein [Actinophytocola gossypii]
MTRKTVRDLVPGDPEQIWLLADSYNRMARAVEDVGRGFRSLDVGGWNGRAAEAFHAWLERQPRRFQDAGDGYGRVAAALDTYASVLAWAQRQAGEVIALGGTDEPPASPRRPASVLTATQQAELTGVITGPDEPEPVRVDQRAQVLSTYHRALAMLDTVGDESASEIAAAARATAVPAPTASPAPAPTSLVVHHVVPPPAPGNWLDPAALRDDPRDWAAAITRIRRRLRWDGLDRLVQHVFEGHYRPGRASYTGYHHREGGVDHGVLRVVEIIDGPDRHGVYTAFVRGPRSTETKKSSFFPDSWSRAEVLHAVRTAFVGAMRNGRFDPVGRRFRGEYRGVRIDGYVKERPAEPGLSDIVTAYPRRARNRRKRT